MAWFKKTRKPMASAKDKSSRVPEGLWVKCPDCSQILYNKDLTSNLNVCPKCTHHFRIGAAERLRMLFDGDWTEHDTGLTSTDPLGFTDTTPTPRKRPSGPRMARVICMTGRRETRPSMILLMNIESVDGSLRSA